MLKPKPQGHVRHLSKCMNVGSDPAPLEPLEASDGKRLDA